MDRDNTPMVVIQQMLRPLCLICVLSGFVASPIHAQDGAEPIGEDSMLVLPEDTSLEADDGAGAVPVPSGPDPAAEEDDYFQPDLSLEENIATPVPETPAPVQGPETAPPPPAPIPSESATDASLQATPIQIMGVDIFGGQRSELKWDAGQSFGGRSLETPVIVVHGVNRGPVLCLTAAVHGDELNGVEIVRRVMSDLDPQQMSGTIIGVPIVNLLGFLRASRYLPDRRDLNRYFPGNSRGSAASRIAYLFFQQIIRNCNYLVDLHTGSMDRTNLPQLRADLSNPNVFRFSEYFGATAVLHHRGTAGTLRRVASEAGIPSVTFELGEPQTLQPEHVDFGVLAIDTLIDKLGMMDRMRHWSEKQPVFYASRWVRSDQGGILLTAVKLGGTVKEGDVLGTVTNPINNEVMQVRSPFDGRVIGMALNQFVLPGFAAFHIGIATKEREALMKTEVESGTPAATADEVVELEKEDSEPQADD